MSRDTCRMPNCDNDARDKGELQYPDNPDATTSDGDRFRISTYGAKFCSDAHELKYDHIKADARDARHAEQEAHR